jgi:transposase
VTLSSASLDDVLRPSELHRRLVLNQLLDGELVNARAADLLGMSVRQVQRLKAAYRSNGTLALVHGNRGRRPAHALDPALAVEVARLAGGVYAGLNQRRLTQMLVEREGLALSRSTVRRILKAPR